MGKHTYLHMWEMQGSYLPENTGYHFKFSYILQPDNDSKFHDQFQPIIYISLSINYVNLYTATLSLNIILYYSHIWAG